MNNFKKDYDSSMDSKYYFSASRVGATTSPQTPNQIGELTSRLNQGLRAVELGAMNQRILDQVPKEHFIEIRRLNKLTNAEASLHAPIQDIDLAGFSQQGWNEFDRQESVEKLKSSVDRAHLMDNAGNIPITVHAGGFPAQKWKKEGLYKGGTIGEGEKTIEDQRSEMVAINQDTGQMQAFRYKVKEYIDGRNVAWTPKYSINNLNRVSWEEEQLKLMQLKKDMTEVQDRFKYVEPRYHQLIEADNKKLLTENEKKELENLKKEAGDVAQYQQEIYQNMRSLAEEMFNRYKKFPQKVKDLEEREKEKKFKQEMESIKEKQKEIDRLHEQRIKLEDSYRRAKSQSERKEIEEKFGKTYGALEDTYNKQTDLIVRNFQNMPAPETWIPVDDFAKEKVSDSITETALYAFKKYGEKAPIISVENVYPEFALSRADSLKATVEEARNKFSKELMSDKKLKFSEKKAKEVAEKLIGVTWDVGHIYMLRKYGYTDKEIQKEAERIGKLVKHIHLTDNFGFEDSHLPPGEGSANIKKQLEEIRKSLGEKEYEKTRAIVEAGEFVANFKETPHLYALSHLDSPLYSEKTDPYWKDIWDTQGNYFAGFGEIMPQKYFDLYGAPGFSQLPSTLGGQGSSSDKGRLASQEE